MLFFLFPFLFYLEVFGTALVDILIRVWVQHTDVVDILSQVVAQRPSRNMHVAVVPILTHRWQVGKYFLIHSTDNIVLFT